MALTREQVKDLLEEARARTRLLIAPLSDEDLRLQHDPLMSPIVWDLGHIAHFEEVWLVSNVQAERHDSEGLEGMYNPFENPRAIRDSLPLPDKAAALEYLDAVRGRVDGFLADLDLDQQEHVLLRDSFVFNMVLQHEYQHNETILQTLQLKRGEAYAPIERRAVPLAPVGSSAPGDSMVQFRGGEVTIGTDDRSAAYDNERPRHTRILPSFWIDANPVSNGDFLRFMADGGYERRELWSEEGWAWVSESPEIRAPKYWFRHQDGRWWTRVMDVTRPVDSTRPVCHVCYYEADAFARWAGKRLPTEFEWEVAAGWDPALGRAQAYPWGDDPPSPARANVDVLTFDTAPIGSYPANVSPLGCYGMMGDVWEWTSSFFEGYPGYETFPYPEYSEVFFGTEYRVLRGGSWATRSGAIRNTFRNWDYPIRRQIFSGFRCARDA
jgi:iron(II)-dependent oxidoreductase